MRCAFGICHGTKSSVPNIPTGIGWTPEAIPSYLAWVDLLAAEGIVVGTHDNGPAGGRSFALLVDFSALKVRLSQWR